MLLYQVLQMHGDYSVNVLHSNNIKQAFAMAWIVVLMIFALGKIGAKIGTKADYAIVVCVGAGIFVLFSILGFCTCRNENKFCCAVNFLLTFALLAVFATVAVLLIAFKGNYLFYLNTACDVTVGTGTDGKISKMLNIYPSEDQFGVDTVCPLPVIENSTILSEIQNRLTVKCADCSVTMADGGYERVPSDKADLCHTHIYQTDKKYVSALATLLGFMEVELGCTGICNETPMNYFSFTFEMPKVSCKTRLTEFVDKYMLAITIVSAVLAGFVLIEMFGLCVICCHPENMANIKYKDG